MKSQHLAACLTQAGRINGLAIDHGRSLDAAIQDARGGQARPDDAIEFKSAVVSVLGPAASLTLVDPLFGPPIHCSLARAQCLVYGYEQDIYRKDAAALVPEMPSDWSVRRFAAIGARGIKLFLVVDPDAADRLSEHRKVVVERVGAECAANGMPFLLEPVTTGSDPKRRPYDILRAVEEFSQDHYHVDVLKVEMPVQPRRMGQVYSHAEALDIMRRIGAATELPLVYLSGGVPFDELIESLEFAGASGSRFNGVVCGRSIWSGGIPVFARDGASGLAGWLENEALPKLKRLAQVVDTHAAPLHRPVAPASDVVPLAV